MPSKINFYLKINCLKLFYFNNFFSKRSLKKNDCVKIGGKKGSNQQQAKLGKAEMNSAAIYLQMNHNTNVKHYETNDDIAEIIYNFTKAIAEYPSKCANDSNEFLLADGACDKQAKIDKNGNGLLNVWTNMLERFQFVSKDQAFAIVSQYPSFYLLMQAYKNMSPAEAKLLLADIQVIKITFKIILMENIAFYIKVRRGAGVLSNVRKLGPELSKKMHKFFTSLDPNEIIAND